MGAFNDEVAIAIAQMYFSHMFQRTLPAGFIAPCLPKKLINCCWFSNGGPEGRRRTEYAYAPNSRYGRFPEEARHASAHNLPGRRDRAQRRLDNGSAADP